MGMTLLTVDDHGGYRMLMQVLAEQRPEVTRSLSASSALTALEACREPDTNVDVVLLDADLGGFDGLALIGALRAAAPGCVVCVVSSAPYADSTSAAQAGADLFIEKGTDPDRVLDLALQPRPYTSMT